MAQSETPERPRGLGERGLNSRRKARQSRRYYALTAASTLMPGLGLIPSRRRTGSIILGGFVLTVLAVLGYALAKGLTSSAISVGVSRRALMILIPVVVIGAIVWIWGVIATARDNLPEGTSGRPKIAMVVFAALAALLVFAPAAQSVRYAVIQRSLIGSVFDQFRPDGATAPGEGEDPWAGTDRVNIMLVGSDAGADRDGIRPDSLMVASIDTQTGETVLFGIPRNLQNIPFSADNPLSQKYPDGYNCGDECLMEYVWTLGRDNADLFPPDVNPGLVATKDAASQILGLHIDYTTVINLEGFTQLVDAMGGVTVDVKKRVCIGCKIEGGVVVGTTGYIEPGVQELDGYHALWYSRSRADSQDGDFSRMRRQRCMVGALLNQVNPTSMLVRYPALAKTLQDNVTVDIPQQDLKAWAELVLRIQEGGTIKSLPLTNNNINVNRPDYAKIHAMVDDAIHPPEPTPSTSSSTSKKTTSSTTTPPTSSSTTTNEDELSDITSSC
ncbi:LCP family protein [Janibacter limosus]|uniref:LCP family protein n=1 Tax=Janibacter limosus TaxID=53458 RepID=UPI00082AA7E3|nr:LCP family protein [Janibacter limosus]